MSNTGTSRQALYFPKENYAYKKQQMDKKSITKMASISISIVTKRYLVNITMEKI